MSEGPIRDLLPHTWHAFFGRFGRLRPIQVTAVPRLVRGDNVLVAAPTASGKTEAVIAPVIERAIQTGPVSTLGLCVLIVAPTRALCNDLLRRLRGPVSACGLRIDIKTGDAPHLDESALPHLLITTPESLDSLLCRRPALFRDLRVAVADDVHLLDQTARGDQLRCLLARLGRVVNTGLQLCGASATVPDAEEMAHRYLGAAARCVQAGEEMRHNQRPIEARLVQARSVDDAARAIVDLFDEAPKRKILVFANRRNDVESLVAVLAGHGHMKTDVFAHHGSLSRGERLRVEKGFLHAQRAICVATMTLEIGIDIGDVDRVVLLGPPPNVSALLQRVGRSNRNDETTHVLCLYSGRFEQLRVEHLLRCAREGLFFPEQVAFRPSVIAQQALSLLFQSPSRWVTAQAVHERLPVETQKRWRVDDCEAMLVSLAEHGFLRPAGRCRYVAEEQGLAQFERGHIHSNIEDNREIEVIDETTGRTVGSVRLSRSDRKAVRAGDRVAVALGGQRREVARVHQHQAVVRSQPGLEKGQFIARQAPRYSYALAQDFAGFLGIEPDTMVLSDDDPEQMTLAHFLGTVWGRLLIGLLQRRKHKRTKQGGPFFTSLDNPLGTDSLGSPEELLGELNDISRRDLSGLARLLQPGPFHRTVPPSLVHTWVLDSIDLPKLADVLSRTRIVHGCFDW